MEDKIAKLAPSILAADFAFLGEQVIEAERGGADRIHVDIMDGHSLPNITIGALIVKSLRRITDLHLEMHMMISDPDFFLSEFVEAGSDSFIHNTLPKIRRVGQMIERIKPECELEVDGGIDEATAQLTIDAGANVLVVGSSIFGASVGVCAAMQRMRVATTPAE